MTQWVLRDRSTVGRRGWHSRVVCELSEVLGRYPHYHCARWRRHEEVLKCCQASLSRIDIAVDVQVQWQWGAMSLCQKRRRARGEIFLGMRRDLVGDFLL